MVTRRRLLVGALMLGAGATLLLAGCDGRTQGKPVRYKMTVEVETPEGLKTGFAVREVEPVVDAHPIAGRGVELRFKGEAVVVDLPGGQSLFALLTGADGDVDYAKQLPGRALGSRLSNEPESEEQYPWRKSAELYPNHPDAIGLKNTNPLPLLVRFGDLSDPTSVEEVKPDDLAASFGAGVKLKRITIEQTDEPVTVGIGKRLGWLEQYWDAMLNGDKIEWMNKSELAAHLASGSFSTMKAKEEK